MNTRPPHQDPLVLDKLYFRQHKGLAWDAVRSKVVVLSLLVYTPNCLWEFCFCLCFVMHYDVLSVNSSFAIILKRKRELVALQLLS